MSDHSQYADVAMVIAKIAPFVAPDNVMLVGARCRDILHSGYGLPSGRLRTTNDTDLAIAIPDWTVFHQLSERFPSNSPAWQRLCIAGIDTDVVPFGQIESPPGAIGNDIKDIALNVYGFVDVFRSAAVHQVSDNLNIRIPRPAGYAVLKVHSWLDRIQKSEYKDGPDLALCVYWYTTNTDRIWSEDHLWALKASDFIVDRAAAALACLRHARNIKRH